VLVFRASTRIWLAILGFVVLACAFAGGLAPFAGAAAGCPVCGRNLIVNPGAEAGVGAAGDNVVAVPGWTRSGGFTAAPYARSGSDLTASSPGPPNRGKNYFYGGPNAAVSRGTQTVSLAAGATAINKGNVSATLSGWLGGYSTQSDDAKLTVSFLGASGQLLGSLTIGPVTEYQRFGASELLLRSATSAVPKGSASAKLNLVMTRYYGSYNDGLADNLSLVLSVSGSSG